MRRVCELRGGKASCQVRDRVMRRGGGKESEGGGGPRKMKLLNRNRKIWLKGWLLKKNELNGGLLTIVARKA